MPTSCSSLKQQMSALVAKLKIYGTQLIAATNARDQLKIEDLSAGISIANHELSALRQQYLNQGCQVLPPRPPIPAVRILIVLDGTASFGPGATDEKDTFFGLSTVIRTLKTPMPGLIFAVTLAHRKADPQDFLALSPEDQLLFTPDLPPGFKFDQFDNNGGLLALYDEIWMFGVDSGPPALMPKELRAIATFMDAGGGVFAVGDHEDLGLAMCGEVLRIRNMQMVLQQPTPAR